MQTEKSKLLRYLRKFWLWYVLGLGLLAFAVLVMAQQASPQASADTRLIVVAIYLLAVCACFIVPYTQQMDQEVLEALPRSLEDLRKLGREYYKNTSAIQDNSALVERLQATIAQESPALLEVKQAMDELLIRQRQENANLKREVEDWVASVIHFFRLLERALIYEQGLDSRATLEKLLQEFAHTCSTRGLERILPVANDTLDARFHAVIGEEAVSEQPSGQILRCESWGYRLGSTVIERAKVVITRSEAAISELVELDSGAANPALDRSSMVSLIEVDLANLKGKEAHE
ncbi:nucleotide exchange factor GrpE [Leptolyngbya sp. 'hensonii']|uniref:nucleotide exchange factor GrpE n=1 Tax=Leptolyngbya sp. 'hensonii' TaxID=1922337 RepID=UPI00094FF390|nr:nucleotide exchange factor GrpE [Leptolyngbya sp. 'hensonii']OLP19992.1 nucleotide exchange factor GrpE [Leptolyngbya sp. 'hensonii']